MIENAIMHGRKKNFRKCTARKSTDLTDHGNVTMIWDHVRDTGGCYTARRSITITNITTGIYTEGKLNRPGGDTHTELPQSMPFCRRTTRDVTWGTGIGIPPWVELAGGQ